MRFTVLILLTFLFANPSRGEEPHTADSPVDFERSVAPLLANRCLGCHSGEEPKGDLDLSRRDLALGQRESGRAIAPHSLDESLVWQYVDSGAMPPDQELDDKERDLLRRWIAGGAVWTTDAIDRFAFGTSQRAGRDWWSLQPLAAVEPPDVPANQVNWAEGPIDRFIAARLVSDGLSPSPPADRRALIRRVTYDLTGLPPTASEVEAFVADESPDAHEKLVDRLLASPRYGEHWGRHWLDVVRFGESVGFERNVIIDDLWPFRDYVIRSFNDDKPFDQFIVEHLAGDVIGAGQPDVEVGVAFLVAGPYDNVGNDDPVAQANIRAATLDDIITATGGAFLGLTVHCARCHDHKFDPIPQADYYRLRAAFEGVSHGRRVLASPSERAAFEARTAPLKRRRAELEADIEALNQLVTARARDELKRRTFTREKVDRQLTEERFPAVEARLVRFTIHADTGNPLRATAARLAEFEVWTAGESPRNVALASAGGGANGARSSAAEDFPEAYGPQLTIDGQFSEQWFVGTPAELTITLAKTEVIDRVAFVNSRGAKIERPGVQGETPCDYEVSVSLDARSWITVATSQGREPWTESHALRAAWRDVITHDEREKLSSLARELEDIESRLDAIPEPRRVWVGVHKQPTSPTFLHLGGDPMRPSAPIAPASLSVLGEAMESYELPLDSNEGQRRLALARSIASADNPLTARVLANRVWHYHFGQGIVDTPSDFGFLGGRPIHPELLDWLAGRLIAEGWRLKPLHREIALSNTYRQSSASRADAAAIDKDARLLWRFPPRRLSAEEIRDTILFTAGVLDLSVGGPGFRLYKMTQNNVCTYFPLDRHGPETYRRGVYHQNARASVVDLLTDFDLPDIAFTAPKRASTTSPLQTLTLLNHAFTLDMAVALADRVAREAGSTNADAQVARVYRIALQRPPSNAEREAAAGLVRSHGLPALCRAILNLNEFIHLD